MIRIRPQQSSNSSTAVGILTENDAWLGPLTDALRDRDVPYDVVPMHEAALVLDAPPGHPLVFNRVSPSAATRGHGAAIPLAFAWLDELAAGGRRVLNGAESFRLETSKTAQLRLLRRLGVAVPRTIAFNEAAAAINAAGAFDGPALLKPDCGGSGASIERVRDAEAFAALPPGAGGAGLRLLQEEIPSVDGSVVRLEFIDDALVYAMRVYPRNTFNLCPAETCVRAPADPDGATAAAEFVPYPDVPDDAVAQAREIVRAAGLDVGGVEYIEDARGVRWFIDINATSVYRADVSRAFGVDPWAMLVQFIERERRKELAKRATPASRIARPEVSA